MVVAANTYNIAGRYYLEVASDPIVAIFAPKSPRFSFIVMTSKKDLDPFAFRASLNTV